MLFSRSARTSLASAALPCAALLVGCADPVGRYEDFIARDTAAREGQGAGEGGGAGGDAPCALPEAGAADGDFLFSLSAYLSPRTPIVFLAKLATEARDGGLGFSLRFQPLEAADRRTPTGTPVDVGPYEAGADGAFTAALPTITVPGNANPISGSDLEATITLTGSLCAPADFVCGDVTGTVARPLRLDLADSTFAMDRITDPTSYPAPVIDCERRPALPLE
ncbi:uncharacterized protein SOCEGT47_067390 [Sorangium cellulosum]|uniref:Uncharacterized protein n=1 Tax=Sorangium cellulosum TaxID=56 RepID=A0A4P2QA93_SORCE|nr:uncharacterized protein SOCEGT47_067390 [Sorangium cellulosum]